MRIWSRKQSRKQSKLKRSAPNKKRKKEKKVFLFKQKTQAKSYQKESKFVHKGKI